jgi:hypothetical protein
MLRLRGLFLAAGVCVLLLIRSYLPIGEWIAGLFGHSSMGGPIASLFAQPKAPEIPADFPSDVPIYPRHKLEEVIRPAGTVVLDLTVDTDAKSVLTYYQQQFAAYGWQLTSNGEEETDDGEGQSLSAAKDGRMALVVVTPLKGNRSSVRQMLQ